MLGLELSRLRCSNTSAARRLPKSKPMADPAKRTGPEAAPAPDANIDEARLRQQAIGVKLRHMFDQIVNEPVPQEFLDILQRADDKGDPGGHG